MIRRPPISTPLYSSAASDVYKRQGRDDLQNLLKNQLELTDQIEEIEKIWMSKVEELESY